MVHPRHAYPLQCRHAQAAVELLLPAEHDGGQHLRHFETLQRCALISPIAGGIGLSIHNIRATGSYIKGTGGTSNGIIPMLRVFNDAARYVDQGGGKRKGAFAVYLEPWHADVSFEFLGTEKNHGKEEMRARDLFYALWIPDLFMERVKDDADWSLFCPNEAPGLFDTYGGEFEALYHRYEQEGRARKTVKAQDLWFAILESRSKPARLTSCTKTPPTKRATRKTWAPSARQQPLHGNHGIHLARRGGRVQPGVHRLPKFVTKTAVRLRRWWRSPAW
jgi:hypothetical protein